MNSDPVKGMEPSRRHLSSSSPLWFLLSRLVTYSTTVEGWASYSTFTGAGTVPMSNQFSNIPVRRLKSFSGRLAMLMLVLMMGSSKSSINKRSKASSGTRKATFPSTARCLNLSSSHLKPRLGSRPICSSRGKIHRELPPLFREPVQMRNQNNKPFKSVRP